MATLKSDFPIERGRRLRGLPMTRVETFADAAFAFAVTLLVISVDDVPRTFDELIVALKSVPIFVFASAQIFISGQHIEIGVAFTGSTITSRLS